MHWIAIRHWQLLIKLISNQGAGGNPGLFAKKGLLFNIIFNASISEHRPAWSAAYHGRHYPKTDASSNFHQLFPSLSTTWKGTTMKILTFDLFLPWKILSPQACSKCSRFEVLLVILQFHPLLIAHWHTGIQWISTPIPISISSPSSTMNAPPPSISLEHQGKIRHFTVM